MLSMHATNPLVSGKGDVCISWGRFVRSFVTFEHLPMVEFEVAGHPGGRKLIRQVPGPVGSQENDWGGDQRMTFDDGEDDAMLNMNDPFSQQMAVANAPIVCTGDMLVKLPCERGFDSTLGCSAVKPQLPADGPRPARRGGRGWQFLRDGRVRVGVPGARMHALHSKTVNPDAEMATSVPATEPTPPRRKERLGHSEGVAMVRGVDLEGRREIRPRGDARSERRSLVEE